MKAPQELVDLPYAHALQTHHGMLAREEDYDAIHFNGGEFEDNQAGDARFTECALTSVVVTGGRFQRARFNDVWMHSVRWVGAELVETDWLDAAAIGSNFAGVTAFSSQLRRVVFQQCKFDSVNFRASTFRDVDFQDCVLRDVDWSGATLTNVTFSGSTLEGVHFAKATLQKVDLRGVPDLSRLADGYDALRGAMIDSSQLVNIAPMLAHTLGITIKPH